MEMLLSGVEDTGRMGRFLYVALEFLLGAQQHDQRRARAMASAVKSIYPMRTAVTIQRQLRPVEFET